LVVTTLQNGAFPLSVHDGDREQDGVVEDVRHFGDKKADDEHVDLVG
jgi:hypothetical protein